jgi:hypothetical protein
MIEIEPLAASQLRSRSPLASRQRGRPLFAGPTPSPNPRQTHAKPNPEAGKIRAIRPPKPANAQLIFASSARPPHPAIPKSP